MAPSKILTRDFVLAFFVHFVHTSANYILVPTLPVYLSRLKTPESEIGVLIGVFSVSSLIFRPLVGKGLLRFPEKTFMVAGAIFTAFSSAAYLVASPFWPFFVVRAFQGVGLAFYFTSSTTLIANISPEERRGQSLSYFFLASNIAFALAPSFGMFLINRCSFTILFFFCTAISLVSLYLTTCLRKREVIPLQGEEAKGDGIFSRKALPASIMTFFTHMVWGSLTAFFPLYAIDHGVANPGFFFAVYAAMLILWRTLGGKLLDLWGKEKVLFPCFINLIVATFILAFSETLPMFILVAVIWGSGIAFIYPGLVALALELAGPARGPAMGTFTAFADLGAGIGAMIMGIVLTVTNYQIMFLCLSLVSLFNFSYFNFFLRKRREPR